MRADIVNIMEQSIRKDYVWNTVGVIFQSLISPLLLIIVTRLNGIDQSGVFSFAFSISIIFLSFGLWGGRTYQVSDVRKRFSDKSYVFVRVLLACAMLLGAILFVLLNRYDIAKSGLLVGLVLMKASESIADAYYGVLQTNGRLYQTGISLTFKTILGFVIFAVIDTFTDNILLSTLGLITGYIAVLLLYDMPQASKFGQLMVTLGEIPSQLKESKNILRVCFPVFIIAFLSTFSLNIPRYFIDAYHNSDIGYYGIIAMPITLIALFIGFILQPNIVRLSRLYSDDYSRVAYGAQVIKILVSILGVGIVVILGAATVGVSILEFVFGKNFSDYYLALMLVVSGGVVSALVAVFINMLIVMRSFSAPMYTLLATNFLLLIGSYVFIPKFGINMAALQFLLVCCAQLLCIFIIYIDTIRKRYTSQESDKALI